MKDNVFQLSEYRDQRVKSLELLARILEEIGSSESFTAQEAIESINPLTKTEISDEEWVIIAKKYSKRHLDVLVRLGVLEYNQQTGMYKVDLSSEYLVRTLINTPVYDLETI